MGEKEMNTDAYSALIMVPANDNNFEFALKLYATSDDLTRAHEYLSNHPDGNKTGKQL
jgi:hypothetical protein